MSAGGSDSHSTELAAQEAARRDEIARGLASVLDRIDAATVAAGRADQPTLIVVTKRFPRSDVDHLKGLGVRDVGENKAQELADKYAHRWGTTRGAGKGDVGRDEEAQGGPAVPSVGGLSVHFIGQLQSNKAGVVAEVADVVHSVDRLKVAAALDRRRSESTGDPRPLEVLLQVSLDGDPARGGVPPSQVHALADAVGELPHLSLRGVMAVAPRELDPDEAFARLREVADGIRHAHPAATWISAGMSGDLEAAIRHGATHLRVGSAILGSRLSLG
ncbi:MAG TPA: YggS family pyridoxal phosphate-dependent enzyme [Phycicoccus sp.]|nr:YggS family pyridoxal phosphate-dependent enzyme [Phycicoccus sp.]HQH06622.1 YggS family pyridoxal phosphate-dependent enzyme [Phycicoccus sp.]HQK30597.1 YggS family pyridoxal phosphate-dependent enzyme [Phycicoccus sp.]HQV90364.1 YggS family pyridoxal phosphate-dependent enzyme [Phycicoccus sp.]HQY95346.1 YggS family pyridoxal phosphate-dependent enzyme [Phycicoccus sp.]